MKRTQDEALALACHLAEEQGAALDAVLELARTTFVRAGTNRELADFALDVAAIAAPQLVAAR